MATNTVVGYAPSVPANIPTPVGELFTKARLDTIERASDEITALAQATLAAHKPGSGVTFPEVFLQSAMDRIAFLGSVVGVLNDGTIDADEIAVQYRLVFGHSLEVRHGQA